MSNFPSAIDDDTTLPFVNDNITETGGIAINSSRDAIYNLEVEVGIGASGTTGSIANRLGVSTNPDGTLKPSAVTSLGLVTLPITNNQISSTAGILESKLQLDHKTQDLFNYITNLSNGVNSSLGWISISGSKLEPHLAGAIYRHTLSQIDVSSNPSDYLSNKFRALRNNTQSFNLINDINGELLSHQFADGSLFGTPHPITTNDGSTYGSNWAHTASGVFINTNRFSTVPQTANDLQQFADYIDNSNIFIYGTRIQNLYTSGISKVSRSSQLPIDGYGQSIIPTTSAIAYLKNTGSSSSPVDDINNGDDIIEFMPSGAVTSNNFFDSQFALVKVGDIIRINYGAVEVSFIIKEKKYIQNVGNKKYIVRINGKNLFYSANALARIERPLFNNNKYGVLSISPVNNLFSGIPSLIVGNPRCASVLSIGFDSSLFNSSHYLLYLVLYPTGNPSDGLVNLPGIDVTGNSGTTPGAYTLESVVASTNAAFRQAGNNFRFSAFSYQGEFGLILNDSYNNASFSIISAIVASNGTYDQAATILNYPNNVIGIFSTDTTVPPDPLSLGPTGANVASPPYNSSYGSAEAAQNPTKIFVPLKRNNYYVNGAENEKLSIEAGQVLDIYGDGYWVATIHTAPQVFPGPNGRVQTTYRIPLDLSSSKLKAGKTIVVQSLIPGSSNINYGRFIIQSINFDCTPSIFTEITVYDSVHGFGSSPTTTLGIGNNVAIYFDSDSVSFNQESSTDFTNASPFKRHFEVYIDQFGSTFTHERGRINVSGGTLTIDGAVPLYTYSELSKLNIIKISSKLRGYQFGAVNKITLNITSFSNSTGIYSGYLASYNGSSFTRNGPVTIGYQGQVTRFYDETNIDYIDILFDINTTISSFTNQVIDFQLFPSLSLDDEIMLLGTCQFNDITKFIDHLKDERQFGNTSEKDLSTSALNYISLPDKLLHSSGVIRGFDLLNIPPTTNPNSNQIYLLGGEVLVNGKLIQVNSETVSVPIINESYLSALYNINWGLCINDIGEYQLIPLLDFDSVLVTPNNPTRFFLASNPTDLTTYNLNAITFSNLINTRQDLVLLYIVSSTVTGVNPSPVVATVTIKDARKYAYKSDLSDIPTLTADKNQGDFYTFDALKSWFNFNSSYSNVANLRGIFSSLPSSLNFNNQVQLFGDGFAIFSLTNNFTTSNVIYNNIIFNLQGSNTITFSNCKLINCTFNFNTNSNTINLNGSSIVVDGSTFNYSGSSNTVNLSGTINFTNNNIKVLISTIFPILSISDGTNGSINNNFFVRGSNTITSYILAPAIYTNGIVSIIENYFDSSTIDGSDQNLVKNLPSTWIYNNNLNTPPTVGVHVLNLLTTYTVNVNDHIILLYINAPITINLPSIVLSPPGRILIIKDASGTANVNTITLHRANITEKIENFTADFTYNVPFGSLTLVTNNGGWFIV